MISEAAGTEVATPRVLLVGVAGAVLLWLAQPPVGWWPLAWIAPACWLWLAESPARFTRRDYLKVWLSGSFYWLLAVHWVRLPHPLTPLGWLPLAAYLGFYPLATVAVVRAARRAGVPLWLAAPVAWTGLELLQARLFTGFLMGALSHSQAGQPWIRSVAAFAGAYGVTFAVVLVASTITLVLTTATASKRGRRLIAVLVAVAGVVGAGFLARSAVTTEEPTGPRPFVALIQGDTRATWDPDPNRGQRIMDRQVALSVEAYQRARRQGRELDLVVWPESMFRSFIYTFDGAVAPPSDADTALLEVVGRTRDWFRLLATATGETPALVGIDRFDWRGGSGMESMPDAYNSAVLVDGRGEPLATYDKSHLVPFGEYIPLLSAAPALYYLTPVGAGLHEGDGPVAMDVPLRSGGTLRLCPTICYETVVPRVVRGHVARLSAESTRPDALVNVTNDAWFWGSSELDMHLACDIYRAVENGLPLLVAANGGLSAVIDATGEVLQVSPRMEEHVLLADIPLRASRPTLYSRWGDWFSGACLLPTALVALGELVRLEGLRRLLGPGAGKTVTPQDGRGGDEA